MEKIHRSLVLFCEITSENLDIRGYIDIFPKSEVVAIIFRYINVADLKLGRYLVALNFSHNAKISPFLD